MDLQNFVQLLANFTNPDNEIRKQAEEAYEKLPVESKPLFLLQCLSVPSSDNGAKEMASVLLRKLFVGNFDEFYPKLSAEVQTQIRSQMLLCIENEPTRNLKKKNGNAAAELAKNFIDDDGNNQWPEFLKFLFDNANSSNPDMKEIALTMFSCVPGVFGNQQTQYLDVIKQMLLMSLQDQANPMVRFAAVKAVTTFLLANEVQKTLQRHYADCLPFMIQALSDGIQMGAEDTVMKSFIDLADSCPQFLRSRIDSLFQVLLKIMSAEDCEDSLKHLAVEICITLSESAPAMVRKTSAKYIPMLIAQLLKMMIDLDEEDEWSTQDEPDEGDNESNSTIAESALDRLACGLGGKSVLPTVASSISEMLQNCDWKHRHAALLAVSAVGEGCHKYMETILSQIVDGILPFLRDPHPRVRYAACNAIGQLSTDFNPVFQKKFHEKVIPGLIMLLDDNDNRRVQAHSAAALVNFIEECPKIILAQYLENIMLKVEAVLSSKFKELVESGKKLVIEQIVTTIATVADTSEEKFTPYYERLMPCLKYILQHASTPELKMLRGKTIECISLIGLAVGKEKFVPDASDIMDMLMKAQTNEGELADDDPQVSYMITAWTRICKILGKDFLPYIPLVMGLVMKTAAIKPDVAVLDSDEVACVDDDDWQFVNLGDEQNFGLKTAGLEEKATACQMLVCYARELKEGFADYAEEVVKLMVPMLKFYFHDSVRVAAAESMPLLLECVKVKGQNYVVDMWNFICPELLKAMESEMENEVLIELMHSFAQCVESLGKGCISEASMEQLIQFLDNMLNAHFKKAAGRQEQRNDEDYDEQVEEALNDEDDEDIYILSKISDITHAIFATYKDAFFPYFDRLLPHFIQLLAADRPWPDHQWGLCIFDDVVEHGGPACIKYQEYFLHPMLNYITSKSGEVRQAASYGAGILGQFGGQQFAQPCAEAIPRLLEVINAPESRAPETVYPTENAIAAITKILKFNASCIPNVDEILSAWLTWLPVHEDADEAPHVYNYLCDLIESNNPIILGNNNCNLPRLVVIIAQTFFLEVLDPEDDVYGRMIRIVRQVQSDQQVFSACIAQLNPSQQQALHGALTAC